MKLLYAKSNWEAAHLPLATFLEKAARDGFDAAEIYLPARPEPPVEIRRLCAAAGLKLVAQIATEGRTPDEHRRSLEALYARAAAAEPLLVNCQTGRDHFAIEDSVRPLRARPGPVGSGRRAAPPRDPPRPRALHRASAAAFLAAVPALRLTADFSHWFCVHESDLADQPGAVAAAVAASDHVHARVGFAEGPQVGDPRGEAFAPWLALHLELWRRIVAARARDGKPFLTITPEFGPAPYMPLRPIENEPVADALGGQRLDAGPARAGVRPGGLRSTMKPGGPPTARGTTGPRAGCASSSARASSLPRGVRENPWRLTAERAPRRRAGRLRRGRDELFAPVRVEGGQAPVRRPPRARRGAPVHVAHADVDPDDPAPEAGLDPAVARHGVAHRDRPGPEGLQHLVDLRGEGRLVVLREARYHSGPFSPAARVAGGSCCVCRDVVGQLAAHRGVDRLAAERRHLGGEPAVDEGDAVDLRDRRAARAATGRTGPPPRGPRSAR